MNESRAVLWDMDGTLIVVQSLEQLEPNAFEALLSGSSFQTGS